MNNPYQVAKRILQTAQSEENSAANADGFTSIDLYGAAVHEKNVAHSGCTGFHLENQSGTGNITLYQVFPGIELVYMTCTWHTATSISPLPPALWKSTIARRAGANVCLANTVTVIWRPVTYRSVPCRKIHTSPSFLPPTTMALRLRSTFPV